MALRQWCGGGDANTRMGRGAARPIGCAATALHWLCGGGATGDGTHIRCSTSTSTSTSTGHASIAHEFGPCGGRTTCAAIDGAELHAGRAMAGDRPRLPCPPCPVCAVPRRRQGLRGALRWWYGAVGGVQQGQHMNEGRGGANVESPPERKPPGNPFAHTREMAIGGRGKSLEGRAAGNPTVPHAQKKSPY